MGMRAVEHASFHPFFHEIAGVEPTSDAAAPIEITSTLWPCLMLGELMFSRAGVVVRAGSDWIDRDIATRSTLYWAYRRAHRPTSDLSVGWGGNSQWRTSFRRDIAAGSMLHFNADGKWDLRAANVGGRADLSIDERVELLTHRSFVRTAKPHDDCWPYDDRLTIAAEV
jgi:hypothetical protein